MKKILILIIALTFSLNVFAQTGVKWETGTFEQVLKKAQKTGKMIFIDCYTSWCSPCKWMSENVFPTKEAGDFFNANFVCVKIDMEKGEGPTLKTKYGVKAFPTFLFLKSDGIEKGRIIGKNEVKPFIELAKTAIDPDNNPETLLQNLKETGNIEFAHKYIDMMAKVRLADFTGEIFNDYWAYIDQYGKFNRKNILYLNRAIQLRKPVVFNYIIDNKADFDTQYGKEVINKILVDAITEECFYFFSTNSYNNQTITPEIMDKAAVIINLLAPDNYSRFMMAAAKAKYSGNTDEFVKYLDVRRITSSFTPRQLMTVRIMMTNFKDLPTEVTDKFIKDITAFYADQLEIVSKK